MDSSTLTAWLALAVSLLALPTSYIVAKQQVKIGLDEHERRVKRRTRVIAADRLDELVSLFFSAAKQLANVDLTQKEFDRVAFERQIGTIDEAVASTGILDRLGKAIDDYTESGDAQVQSGKEIATKLQIIRGQIHRGSGQGQYAAWNILNLCRGNELSSLLRNHE